MTFTIAPTKALKPSRFMAAFAVAAVLCSCVFPYTSDTLAGATLRDERIRADAELISLCETFQRVEGEIVRLRTNLGTALLPQSAGSARGYRDGDELEDTQRLVVLLQKKLEASEREYTYLTNLYRSTRR